MLVSEKYQLQREVGWSKEAEVHVGPIDPVRKVPVAVKIRHGMGGPPRPNGNRERFLRAVAEQQAAAAAGCRRIAPIFESGHEGDNAFYATKHYPLSAESLIQGRVALDAASLRKLTEGVLLALEELRDRQGRAHGNLKTTNIFFDGKSLKSASAVLSDLALAEESGSQAADCYLLGATIFQLVRGRTIRNFDWPIQDGPEWERLGPQGDDWREFCNLLMSPDFTAHPEPLKEAHTAFKYMRRLATAAGGDGGNVPGSSISWQPGKGLVTTFIAGVAAAAAAGVLFFQPANAPLKLRLRRMFTAAAPAVRTIDVPVLPAPVVRPAPSPVAPLVVSNSQPFRVPERAASLPLSLPLPSATPLAVASPPPSPIAVQPVIPVATPETAPSATPPPSMPVVADAPPVPPPVNPGDKWVSYAALLGELQQDLRDPLKLEQPDALFADLTRLRDDVGYLPVATEPSVTAFLARLPLKIEATGDQPDLAPSLWTKEGTTRQGDLQSVTYQWQQSGFRVKFNRLGGPGGNVPAFYLCDAAVPVQFGLLLAKVSQAEGPLAGAASAAKGPVAWQFANGNYTLRSSWMALDSVNRAFYEKFPRPTADSPMNGLSANDAIRLARAAGCTLPTLAQWNATLASPGGQLWVRQWQNFAKVRSPVWAAFAKDVQSRHITGAQLPNYQCFAVGDRGDLNAVGLAADPNFFFEPVTARALGGFAQLIGNVGQFIVDEARNPNQCYFAGGSAQSPPAAFQSLTAPPVVSRYLPYADGGLRLAAAAKGDGSGRNPVVDKLKADVEAEVARVQKLQ